MNNYRYRNEPSAPPYPPTYPFSQPLPLDGMNNMSKNSQSNYSRAMRSKMSSCRCCSVERVFIVMAILFAFLLIFLYNECSDGGDCFDNYDYEALYNSSNLTYSYPNYSASEYVYNSSSSELILSNATSPINSTGYYNGYYRSTGWHGPSWITWLLLGSAARNMHRNNLKGAAAAHILPRVMNKGSKGIGGGIFGSRIGGRSSGGKIGGGRIGGGRIGGRGKG